MQLKRRNPHLQCPHCEANDYTSLSKCLLVIQQTGCENAQTNQVEDDILIKHQILETHLHGNVKQLEERSKG